MSSYRIPNDARVRESLVRVFSTRPVVDSQRRLKALVEKDLKGDEKYQVGEPRLRVLAIESGLVDLEIHTRDTTEMRSLEGLTGEQEAGHATPRQNRTALLFTVGRCDGP